MLRRVAASLCAVVLLSTATPTAAAVVAPNAAAATTQSGGSLSLTVTDGDDPIAGADVTVSRDGEVVVAGETGSDGTLETGSVADGSYVVSIQEPGYEERTITVAVDGNEVTRTVTLDPGSVELSIQAVDSRTNEPLRDARIEIEGIGSLRTAGDGTQTVQVPVNSQISVSVSKDGYETSSATVVVAESAESVTLATTRTASLSLSLAREELPAGESVEATVTDAYGDPVAGAPVLVDGDVVAETDGDGTATVPVNTAGEHTVRARAGGTLSNQVQVLASQSKETGTAPADANDPNTDTETGEEATDTTATATPVPSATSVQPTTDANPFPDIGSAVGLPDLAWGEGPLGVLPPFEGPVRIISVIALVGLVGLLYSVFGSRNI